jgi:hypothetical protein
LRNFEYDEHERLTKIIVSNANPTLYSYLDNDRVSRISYNVNTWEEFEYLENGQLKTTRTYKDSALYQIDKYEYGKSVIYKETNYFYDFLPNDTTFEYTSNYYNADTLASKIIHKSEDSSGWVTFITSARYVYCTLHTVTYCLTNDSPCSYIDNSYDKAGNLIASIAYSNGGELKTRSTVLKYEFW